MSANDRQEGGTHYASEYQHWDFVLTALEGRYLEGCVTKYIYRWKKKNGLEDLRKAAHYLDKMMDSSTKYKPMNKKGYDERQVEAIKFTGCNNCDPKESAIIVTMAVWQDSHDLLMAKGLLGILIKNAEHLQGAYQTKRSV